MLSVCEIEVSPKVVYFRCAKGKYCFPCVNGVCPFGLDLMRDCFPKFTPEIRALFNELIVLRSKVAMMNGSSKA